MGGNIQLCLGQTSRIEHAIHALRRDFEKENCEAILMIDAANAFNFLNRTIALEIFCRMCPSLHIPLPNSYQTLSPLFVDRKAILSCVGSTQGELLAMLMYRIAIRPLILKLQTPRIVQKWYADDGNAAGSLQQLHELFEDPSNQGPSFGYHVNAPKRQLIAKPSTKQKDENLFANTNVPNLNGARVLGSVIGSDEDMQEFLKNKNKHLQENNSKTLKIWQIITPHSLPLLRQSTRE